MTRPDFPVVARPTADDQGESWSLLGVPAVVGTGDVGSMPLGLERGCDVNRRGVATDGLEGVSGVGGMVPGMSPAVSGATRF